MFAAEQLTDLLCEGLNIPILRLAGSSRMAGAFALDTVSIPTHVLARHAAEHIFRIRMFRPLDAAATHFLNERPGDVAAKWAKYARSEAVHDRYFLRDLAAVGLDCVAIKRAEPFKATVRLGDFVNRALQAYGALPVVLYSFWAEQNSEIGSPPIAARTQAIFGRDATKGAVAHRALDEGQSHPALISHVLTSLIRVESELLLAMALLETITDFLGEYFDELGEWSEQASAEAFFITQETERQADRHATAACAAVI